MKGLNSRTNTIESPEMCYFSIQFFNGPHLNVSVCVSECIYVCVHKSARDCNLAMVRVRLLRSFSQERVNRLRLDEFFNTWAEIISASMTISHLKMKVNGSDMSGHSPVNKRKVMNMFISLPDSSITET